MLARCVASGELDAKGGRVEIRYGPRSVRAYMAAARNLQPVEGSPVFPDDHCAEAEVAPPRSSPRKKPKKAAAGAHRSEPDGREVLVYADGACSGNPGPAGLGVVLRFDDQLWELSEYLGVGTNNIAELTAILRAAEKVEDRSRPVRIHTDSKYSIGVLAQGWKAKANRDLVQRVKGALAELDDVELIHVPGHAGVPLNELADALARRAIETRRSAGWQRVEE